MIMNKEELSKLSAIRRLPAYTEKATALKKHGMNATMENLAGMMNLPDSLIKRDLCKLGAGNMIGPYAGDADMTELLENCLMQVKPEEAVMIADGLLGKILMEHFSLLGPGINLLVAFDADEKTGGRQDLPNQILPVYKFTEMTERLQVKTGILCVPHAKAQAYANLMKAAGITAVWNWSGIALEDQDNFIVLNEECGSDPF